MSQFPLHDIGNPPESLPFNIHHFGPDHPWSQASYPHRHEFYQILFITSGQGTHVIDFEPFKVDPPVLYFLSPGQVHFWQMETMLHGYGIVFDSDFLLFDSPHGFNKLEFFHNLSQLPQLKLTPTQAAPITALIEALDAEYQAREFNYASVLSAYLHILLSKIQRLYVADETDTDHSPVLARRFQQLVSIYFLTERSVTFYAERIGVSAGYLTEVVKTVTGYTAGQIIRQALALEAKRLLINTDLTIEQICDQLSFEDPSYFGRFFKRETQQSPGHFRHEIREKYQIAPV